MAYRNTQNTSNLITVENVPTFRRYQSPNELCVIPEVSQKRKLTDVPFLVTFGLCIVVLLSLMIYAGCNSNIDRFIHGYDSCGNVCGSKNSFVDGIACSGKDMSNKPFLVVDSEHSTCIEKCNFTWPVEKFHRCFRGNGDLDFFSDTLEKIDSDSTNLIIVCFIGLGLSVLALVLFRYFVGAFVWAMLITTMLLFFGLTGFFWYLYSDASSEVASSYLASSIIFTIASLVFALCILAIKPNIKLIIRFIEEAVKIVFTMPMILVEPVLTFISNFVVIALFIYTFWLMASSGTLEHQNNYYTDTYEYVPNGAMIFVLWWSVIMMLWMVQFVLACQQMVISGAVATQYFTRDLTVVSPIYSSFYNLIRYHLGTVAFGSFIITLITVIKIIIRALSRENGWWRLLYICFRPLEDLLKYVTSMGYIETAIHGQPLCRSGVRAINLIVSNLLSAVALNSISNLVFFMVKFIVTTVAVGISLLMGMSTITTVLAGIIALLCIHCFFVVFEVAIDTLFICYCEDQSINDGNTNPYYTSVYFHEQIKIAQVMTAQQLKGKKKK